MSNGMTSGTTGVLTDGTGVSKLTSNKLFKDFVLDVLLSFPLVFVGLSITDIHGAVAAPVAVGLGIVEAIGRAGYRAALRYFQSDSVD